MNNPIEIDDLHQRAYAAWVAAANSPPGDAKRIAEAEAKRARKRYKWARDMARMHRGMRRLRLNRGQRYFIDGCEGV